MKAEFSLMLAAGAGNVQGYPWGGRGLGSPCRDWGESVWHQPHPSPQAYVNRFKFQSITADDTLGFFLEYFPELKEKGVDSIPGQYSTILARKWGCHFTAPHPRVSESPMSPGAFARRFGCSTGDAGGTDGTAQLGSLIFLHSNLVPALHLGAVSWGVHDLAW